MPSAALPAVVATLPAMPNAPVGPSDGGLAGEAGASAADGGAAGAFAAVLGKQMSGALQHGEATKPLVTGAVAKDDGAAATPAADLSALLQGLMLPMMAQASQMPTASPKPAMPVADTPLAAAPMLLPTTARATEGVDARSVLPLPTGDDEAAMPQFASLLPEKAAEDAGKALRAADSAAKDNAAAAIDLQSAHHAATAMAHRAGESAAAERPVVPVTTPVSSPNWHEDLGNKVSMLIGKEIASADLVLTPPNLGRVEVQLNVSGDQTIANFVAATPAARDALEQALPKLREFLADAGINLAGATVGGDAQAGQGNGNGAPGRRGGSGGEGGPAVESVTLSTSLRRAIGMVDTFA